ncbi:DNA topoisomerase 3 [Synergistales bacterium]|nr:DNA topoisomerase 3 [Synergistales bacterium]
MRLIIAEKPSLARAIVSAIDSGAKKEVGYFKCKNGDVVTWLLGHVLEQLKPDDYCDEWSKWNIESLPMVPKEWQLKQKPSAKAIIQTVKSLLRETSEVVNAGDPDREGQLLVDEFLDFFGWKGKTLRLLLKDLTPEAIRKSFEGMKDNAAFQGLKNAAIARQRADWIVGMNATRYFTIAARGVGHDGVLSIGRVQTPTLGLVVRRDNIIDNFKSIPYYVLKANINLSDKGNILGIWQPNSKTTQLEEGYLADKSIAEKLLQDIKGKPAKISKYERKEKSESPPLPYRLSDLQVQANKKLGLTLKNTLDTVQNLYEKQVVSYPRSDCQYLPESHHANAAHIIEGITGTFPQYAESVHKSVDLKRKSKAFDDSKVAEHYAITPTGKKPSGLSEIEMKVYEMICVRYLMQFMPIYKYHSIVVEFLCGPELFCAIGRDVTEEGWKHWDRAEKKDPDDDADEQDETAVIPRVAVGDTGVITDGSIQDKKTKPPKPYNDGTLVKAMSNIHQYVKAPEIAKQLREVDGIGTSATQYTIVEKLLANGFLERRKKEIHSTDTGKTLISVLENGIEPAKILAYPDMTALWEKEIGEIEKSGSTVDKFLSGVIDKIAAIVKNTADMKSFSGMGGGVKGTEKCPKCGGAMRKIKGKNGVFWGCQNQNCKVTFDDDKGKPFVSRESVCPVCGGTAKSKLGQYGTYWRCGTCDQILKDENGKPVEKAKKPGERKD